LFSLDYPTDTGLGGAVCHDGCLTAERELTRLQILRVDTNTFTDTFIAGTPQAALVGTADFAEHASFSFYLTAGTWMTTHFLPLVYGDSDLLKGQTYYYALAVSNSAGEGNLSLPRYEMAIETPSPPRDLSVQISGELSLNTTWLAPLDNGDGLVASLSTPRPMHKYVVEIDVCC